MWPRDGCVPPRFLEVDNFLSFVDFLPGPWGQSCNWSLQVARLSHGGGPNQVPRISGQSGLLPWPALWMRFLRTDHFMDICLGALVSKGMHLLFELQFSIPASRKETSQDIKIQNVQIKQPLCLFLFLFFVHMQEILKSGVGRVAVCNQWVLISRKAWSPLLPVK